VADVYRKGPVELRLGDYREVLADLQPSTDGSHVWPNTVLADPPFSARTHNGQRHARKERRYTRDKAATCLAHRGIEYTAWTDADLQAFVARWGPVPGWLGVLTSHDLVPRYETLLRDASRYVFAPLSCVQHARNVRLAGDGPANWTDHLVVSRPRTLRAWGALPGAYVGTSHDKGENSLDRSKRIVPGGKPLWLMRALVRDYSRPGDLVCDPCAGGATTLIAAALEGRRAIGAELDPDTYAKACARIERTALTPPLPGLERDPMDGTQEGLDL